MITRALWAAVALAAAQDELHVGRERTVAIEAGPVRLLCAVERAGTLHVYATSEDTSPVVALESAAGELLGVGAGEHGPSASVALELDGPAELRVVVEAERPGALLVGARLLTEDVDARAAGLERRGHEAYRANDLPAAAEAWEEAHALRAATWPPDHPPLQDLRLYLAMASSHLGEHARALELQELVRASRARTLPPLSVGQVEVRNDIAVTLLQMGDVRGAYAGMQEVLELVRAIYPEDHPRVQHACANLAEMARHMGDLEGAFELEGQLLEVRTRTLGPEHDETYDARLRRAVTLDRLGRFEESRDLAAACLAGLLARRPPDSALVVRARGALAAARTHLEDFAGAEELYRENLAILERALPPGSQRVLTTRLNLAVMRKAQGDHAAARALEQEALAVLERISVEDDPTLLRARRNLAWSHAGLGDEDGARRIASGLAETLSRSIARAAATVSPREAEAIARGLGKEVTTVVQLAGPDRIAPSDELDRTAFELVESFRSIGLLAARSLRRASDSERARRLRAAVRASSAEIGRMGAREESAAALHAAVRARDAKLRELQSALAAEASPLAFELDHAALAEALDGRAAAAYWKSIRSVLDGDGRERRTDVLLAWVLRPDGTLRRVEIGTIEAVRAAVDAWREVILAPVPRGRPIGEADPLVAERAAGAALRALVLDPVRAAAPDGAGLVVVPDDVLHRVPLDALPLEDGCVGDALAIERRSSLRELLFDAPPAEAPPVLLALGGIEYGDSTDDAWDPGFVPLPGTAEEVGSIEALFRRTFGPDAESRRFEGRAASKDALAASAPGARWLHLATHGYFAGRAARGPAGGLSPLSLCGLALAEANRPPDGRGRLPGVLTGEELAALDLAGCELAVLSACDTNVGLARDGQGVASLQRALHMAGARSVVTSLWRVPDDATRALMTDFYRRTWVQGKPKAVALWEAKRRLRDELDVEGRPRYGTRDWAAWVLTGDPR